MPWVPAHNFFNNSESQDKNIATKVFRTCKELADSSSSVEEGEPFHDRERIFIILGAQGL